MKDKNKNFWHKNDGKIFWLIIVSATVLRLWNISVFDVAVDHALYSFRALGWFDFLGGGQTAPIQWFGSIPVWALLSFHDCPPLVFFIQKIFFFIFGDSTFTARLPFVLAGILSVYSVYLLVNKIKSVQTALWAAALVATSSYAVWASYAGYLEGVEVLFIVLSLYFFSCYLTDGKEKNLYLWSAAAGLAFLSKYTSIFLLPVGLVCLTINNYGALMRIWKKAINATLIFLGVISPVLIYNAMVYKYRGHFDASLSAIVGMHPQDYSAVSARAINANIIENFYSLINNFPLSTSWPLVVVFILSLAYLLIKIISRRSSQVESFILLNVLAAALMFCFGQPVFRQVSILIPLLVVVVAVSFDDLNVYLRENKHAYWNNGLKLLVVSVLFVEFVYCLNTNILAKPLSGQSWLSSSQRLQSFGWNELESYWRDNLLSSLPPIEAPKHLEDMKLSSNDLKNRNVIFYDDSVNWFSYFWYIQKYQTYYHLPILPVSFLFSNPDFIQQSDKYGVRNIYYTAVVNPDVLDPVVSNNENLMQAIGKLRQDLEATGANREEIKSRTGETAFIIYKIK